MVTGKKGERSSRYIYKGHMDKAKGGGGLGVAGRDGWGGGERCGESGDSCA